MQDGGPLTPSSVPASSVLDATCVLALLFREPGAAVVAAAFARTCLLSTVNYQEVVAKLVDRGMESAAIDTALQLPFELVDFDEEQALTAGLLRATTRAFGLSAGDRACLALAKVRELTALTADRAWVAVADASVALIR
jgi:ribonuclease VapC